MAPPRAPMAASLLDPTGQAAFERMRGLAESLLENPVTQSILDTLPGYALVLTQDRRLLAGHPQTLEELGLTTPESLQALRTGELFRCTPVQEGFSRSRQFWVSSSPLRLGGGTHLLFIF